MSERVEMCHHGRKIACLECVDEGPEEEYMLRADRNRLTAEVARLQAERDELRAGLMIPGAQRCVDCGYELHKLTLRAEDGAVGVNADAAPESCPNGCGPLIGVTYEQGWRDMIRIGEEHAKGRAAAEAELEAAQKDCARLRAERDERETALETIERRLSEGQGNQPWCSCEIDLAIVREARETLRSTPASILENKTLTLQNSGTSTPTPITSDVDANVNTGECRQERCRQVRETLRSTPSGNIQSLSAPTEHDSSRAGTPAAPQEPKSPPLGHPFVPGTRWGGCMFGYRDGSFGCGKPKSVHQPAPPNEEKV